MKILTVGAGAIGGYFGGRLAEAGADVTFLVREHRQRQLEADGLVIESLHGHFRGKVKTITRKDEHPAFDVILIALKAYHLEGTLQDIAEYVHEKTLLVPLLNGYRHYEALIGLFGKENVLGGLCFIESTVHPDTGAILQTSPRHDIVFGGWDGNEDERIHRLYEAFKEANCNAVMTDNIVKDIWQKYILIASMSGITTLFRSAIGPILENRFADEAYRRLIGEICTIANNQADGLPEDIEAMIYQTSTSLTYDMKSSMLRDMEKGLPTEGEHLQGYLLEAVPGDYPVLELVYNNLSLYEMNRSS